MIPPMKPIVTAAHGRTSPQPAVIETRPARMPLSVDQTDLALSPNHD